MVVVIVLHFYFLLKQILLLSGAAEVILSLCTKFVAKNGQVRKYVK